MLYPKIETCVEKIGSKYALARVVGVRAQELQFKMAGEFQSGSLSAVTYALEEIENGEITVQALQGQVQGQKQGQG